MPRRPMTIRRALEWAFGDELARLDFDEAKGDNARPGVSSLWVIAQRGNLGCTVDGGGYSLPHHDADMIASAVAALPQAQGGRRMAVQIAALARAGQVPDWCRDDRVRCVPRGWKSTRHGEYALTEYAPGTEHQRSLYRDKALFRWCPVSWTPTAQEVSAKRRNYLAWWGALLHLQSQLRTMGALDRVRLTRAMPPMTPWRAGSAQGVEAAA